jgi:hypothetical protein
MLRPVEGLYYIKSTSLYFLSFELAPLSHKRVCPHPLAESKRGLGKRSLASEGAGEAHSDDWRESQALCLLCMCLGLWMGCAYIVFRQGISINTYKYV